MEDLDATFFDANNDGYPDLYVVSGGNEYEDGNALLGDRLFLNDGKGHFNISATALPVIYTNKSTVSIADVDKDGDNDLFRWWPRRFKKLWHTSTILFIAQRW